MGTNLRGIIEGEEIELEELKGKAVAMDAYNALMQFLTVIRLPTGEPLRDSKGRITSHLSGIFYRSINLMKYGVKLCYVFDGPYKPFKERAIEEREFRRREAEEKLQRAIEEGREEEIFTYAVQTARITEEITESARELLSALGIPCIQAPSEGEAQCAYMCMNGSVWASASQDWDSLMFGSPRLVRNLNIVGRRKLPKKHVWIKISAELYELDKVLKELAIDREKLILLGLLIGTDYNPGGVKGIGPKRALALVQVKGVEQVKKEIDWEFESSIDELIDWYMNPKIEEHYELRWGEIDRGKVVEILCEEYDFSRERIEKALDELEKKKAPTTLIDFQR